MRRGLPRSPQNRRCAPFSPPSSLAIDPLFLRREHADVLDDAAAQGVGVVAALEGRDEQYVRSRVLDTIRLANVRLAQRVIEEAAIVAGQAVEMSGDLTSTIVLDRLVEFQERLSPAGGSMPEVGTFQERLKTYLGRQVDGWS